MATAIRSNVETMEDVRRALAQLRNESARWASAWCLFAGTDTGSITPLAQYNIPSVQRISLGVYDVYFTTPMPNTLYATFVFLNHGAAASPTSRAVSYGLDKFQIFTETTAGAVFDAELINVLVFGPRG